MTPDNALGPTIPVEGQVNGIELIAKERQRQIEQEGWTADHDAHGTLGDLCVAGACYALDVAAKMTGQGESWKSHYLLEAEVMWPWDAEWKPTPDGPIRQLVKAGALIAAEIDRLQRLEANR